MNFSVIMSFFSRKHRLHSCNVFIRNSVYILANMSLSWYSGNSSHNFTWNKINSNQAQFNQQAHQLQNMLQTRQLLAAVQTQANLASQQSLSMMNDFRFPRQGRSRMHNQRGGRSYPYNRACQGLSNRRHDRKRKHSPRSKPFTRDRRNETARL